jgi:FAD/FMN-containing dehydrogenase
MPPSETLLTDIRSGIRGRVVAPGDDVYDEARTPFYGGIDRRPAAIARPVDAADVATIVSIVGRTGAELAVRSGGHSLAGDCVTDGGVVIDLREMTAIDVDADGGTAWIETGLTAVEVAKALAAHDAVLGLGDTGSVGIGGITLGGGVGFLVRKHGLTIDDLIAAEIVTADGEILAIDEANHPDLFWAIRGGGGNFGVATRFRFRLHALEGVVGGIFILPATPESIAAFLAEAEAAPEELSTIANVMPAPPMPFLPPDVHGTLVLMAMMCFAGDPDQAEKALAPFRAIATPITDLLRPMSYPEIYLPDQEGFHPTAVSHTMFTDAVDRSSAEQIVERLEASTAPFSAFQLRALGGAMARVPADATAFAHRDRRLMVNIAAMYEEPAQRPRLAEWVDGAARALQRGPVGAYVNFLSDEGESRVRDAYPGKTWDRLATLKRRYDPANLFRLNQNIPPGAPVA